FKNLNKLFPKKRQTIQPFKNLSFNIHQHHIFPVIPYTPPPKTTLLPLLNQLHTVSHPQLILHPHHIHTYKQKDLPHIKKHIPIIFQHFNFLNSKSLY
ncbi:P-loop NTPase family protein, partial [Staphylococcus epidermidis]